MVILYGNDQATREDAKTTSKIRKWQHLTIEEDFIDFINDIDNLVSQNEVILENVNPFINIDNDNLSNFSAHERQSQDPSPREFNGNNKKKKKVVEKKESPNELNNEMKEAMYEVAEALREGNAIMRECHNLKLPPILGEKTLEFNQGMWMWHKLIA